MQKFTLFHDFLTNYQKKTNMIGRGSINHIWIRHFADSAKLLEILLNNYKKSDLGAKNICDVGSGAGFPGMVLAILMQEIKCHPKITLVESNSKKCEYLDELRDLLRLKLVILNDRAETIEKRFDIITARAVAPLKKLLPIVFKIKKKESLFFLLKGKNWYKELKEIKNDWKFNIKIVKNREILDTSGGVTIELRKLSKR